MCSPKNSHGNNCFWKMKCFLMLFFSICLFNMKILFIKSKTSWFLHSLLFFLLIEFILFLFFNLMNSLIGTGVSCPSSKIPPLSAILGIFPEFSQVHHAAPEVSPNNAGMDSVGESNIQLSGYYQPSL